MRGKKRTHERVPLRCDRYESMEYSRGYSREGETERGRIRVGWEGQKEERCVGESRSRGGRETLGEATHDVSGVIRMQYESAAVGLNGGERGRRWARGRGFGMLGTLPGNDRDRSRYQSMKYRDPQATCVLPPSALANSPSIRLRPPS